MNFGVHEAAGQGSCVNDTVRRARGPGHLPGKSRTQGRPAWEWATVEDEKDALEAMRLDRQDAMIGDIIDPIVEEGNVSASESEDGEYGGESVAAPLSYAHDSVQFSSLESLAKSYNNDEAAYHLQKANVLH